MRRFESLSDVALDAKIASYETAIEKAELRGVGRVSGEGRMIEFVTSNLNDARGTLRELLFEKGYRTGEGVSGGSLRLDIG